MKWTKEKEKNKTSRLKTHWATKWIPAFFFFKRIVKDKWKIMRKQAQRQQPKRIYLISTPIGKLTNGLGKMFLSCCHASEKKKRKIKHNDQCTTVNWFNNKAVK